MEININALIKPVSGQTMLVTDDNRESVKRYFMNADRWSDFELNELLIQRARRALRTALIECGLSLEALRQLETSEIEDALENKGSGKLFYSDNFELFLNM